jgi:hypothetical protein
MNADRRVRQGKVMARRLEASNRAGPGAGTPPVAIGAQCARKSPRRREFQPRNSVDRHRTIAAAREPRQGRRSFSSRPGECFRSTFSTTSPVKFETKLNKIRINLLMAPGSAGG